MMARTNIRRTKIVIKSYPRFIAFLIVAMMLLYAMTAWITSPNLTNADLEKPMVSVTVCKGDSLWSIAEEQVGSNGNIRGMVDSIKSRNNLKSASLTVGQTLIIPAD